MSSHNNSSGTSLSIPERGRSVIWAQLTQAPAKAQGNYIREICTISLVYIFLLFKDNALKEWSYKKAVTIQTYEYYNPIHAPFNIISEFFFLHWWNKEKERVKRDARQCHDEKVKTIAITVVILTCKMLCAHFKTQTRTNTDYYRGVVLD